jgi:hypothetical protein
MTKMSQSSPIHLFTGHRLGVGALAAMLNLFLKAFVNPVNREYILQHITPTALASSRRT